MLVEGDLGSRLRGQACRWDLLGGADAGALRAWLQGRTLFYLLRLDLLLICLIEHSIRGLPLLLVSLVPLLNHIGHAGFGRVLRELKLSCVNAFFRLDGSGRLGRRRIVVAHLLFLL